jgi:RNA polymerase sigma-70 factor (ECF subfamily)
MVDQDSPQTVSDLFVTRLMDSQFSLFTYICMLLGDAETARDVLQETNLDVWRKAASYDFSRPFLPWARAIARYQVLTYRKKQARERLLFDNELLENVMAEEADDDAEQFSQLYRHLKDCMEKLNHFQRAVVEARYMRKQPLAVIAREQGCSVAAVGMMLLRVRGVLAKCIRGKMAGGAW